MVSAVQNTQQWRPIRANSKSEWFWRLHGLPEGTKCSICVCVRAYTHLHTHTPLQPHSALHLLLIAQMAWQNLFFDVYSAFAFHSFYSADAKWWKCVEVWTKNYRVIAVFDSLEKKAFGPIKSFFFPLRFTTHSWNFLWNYALNDRVIYIQSAFNRFVKANFWVNEKRLYPCCIEVPLPQTFCFLVSLYNQEKLGWRHTIFFMFFL